MTLRLYCLGSYFINGFRFGLHSSTTLGGAQGVYSTILNPGGTFIGKGAMTTFPLTGPQWAPFAAAGITYLVLAPDAADLDNPSWDGFCYGGGGSTQFMPVLKVTYT